MKPVERFHAVAHGLPLDRIPVCCNLLDQGAKELGVSIREYYARPDLVAEGQLRLFAKYGSDVVWGTHYAGRDAEILGVDHMIFSESGPPNVGRMLIQEWSDIEKLRIPEDLDESPAWRAEAETVRLLKGECAGTVPVMATVTGAFTLPALLMGIEKWMELLFFGPAEARVQLLEKCSDFTVRKARALHQAGADVVVYNSPVASQTFLTLANFEKLALPWILRDYLGMAPVRPIYFCGGGEICAQIPLLVERVGVPGVYLSPNDDIAKAVSLAAGRCLVVGTINDILLLRGDEALVEREVARILELGRAPFLFGTLVMPFDIEERMIRHLLQAAHRWGACREGGRHG